MSEVINVAVFPCGSEVGLEIHRSLKYYRHFHLIGLSSVQDHGRIVYDDYQGAIPYLNDDDFVSEIKKTVEEKRIRFLIPAMDEAGYILKKNEQIIGCEVVYPEISIAEILRKKSSTYEILQNVIKTPEVYKDINETEGKLPVFIKPDIGYGSRGARIIDKKEDLESISSNKYDFIVMENLPGKEFTIDCFSDNNANLIFSGARERDRVRMGVSVSTRTVEDQKPFAKFANKISQALNLKGLWFFQLKEDRNGDLTLLEVAGRVSGSMALYRALGVNFIIAELFQRLGAKIQIPHLTQENALMERAFDCKVIMELNFDTVYCDLDDCLIINDTVNHNLVAFLYQCLNKRKLLVLVTRHERNPIETLKNYRLSGLFDEIKHIKDRNTHKATEIISKKAIFIDDSFEERQNVSENCAIPTFAPDAIDLLIIKHIQN